MIIEPRADQAGESSRQIAIVAEGLRADKCRIEADVSGRRLVDSAFSEAAARSLF